ncbi:hypothetical protein LZZ85_03625 [Terrimonas sp. NA20]|uniref:Uncharacterized protein n=1 Tax=Terrimonas ginsenosidimutans TaxID=2908004 RepID=A0ABS9KM27_9BACT|nr:hypothetical protein [Terrimonas ginsenosidimutans]MCG2613350.1 hypothetical protein [Terrimonas ginsenosidimutans]
MKEVFIKKYWAEENILFYLHFQDGKAVRQIEVTPGRKIFLSADNPQQEDCTLYDQLLDDLEIELRDLISQTMFEKVWKKGG